MTLHFDAVINGKDILCSITSSAALPSPVFCFSLMAPPMVADGGTLIRSVGGYGEVQLPNLAPGVPHVLTLRHANTQYRPTNRAWLPLGGYLRLSDGTCRPLPVLPAGIMAQTPPPPGPFAGLRLIPQPESWAPAPGILPVPSGFGALGEPFDAVDALSRRNGIGPFLTADGPPLTIHHDLSMPPEAYRLDISPDGVTVAAAGRAGLLYGAITLLQLRITHDDALPCGLITDAPRFGWRGQHLDCARHYFQPETILRLLDMMALFKLNRFHWHFADDEAFRLEVACHPDLWRNTAFRGERAALPGVFGGGIRSGGSYGPDAVQAVIARGAALNIQILPEIEVPAHALAVNAVIPGLRDPDDTGTETSVQGYRGNTLNPAMPATWDFLTPLLAEVAAQFPIGILHLGCDELPPATWAGSPAVTALSAREGLCGRDDVQGWMMAKLGAQLAQAGIRPAAWEEAAKGANGGIGHDAILFSWTGQGAGIAAARAGHDVVMCPAQNVYLDMAHSSGADDWGATWAAFIALEDTVDWQPVPRGAEDIAARVIGVQGTFWAEFTTDDTQMEAMLAPRILGVANKAWDRRDSLDGAGLRALAGHVGRVFDRIGWARHGEA